MGSGHQYGGYRIIPTESRLEAAGIRSGEEWGILDVSGSGTGGFLMDCMRGERRRGESRVTVVFGVSTGRKECCTLRWGADRGAGVGRRSGGPVDRLRLGCR